MRRKKFYASGYRMQKLEAAVAAAGGAVHGSPWPAALGGAWQISAAALDVLKSPALTDPTC